MFYLCVAIVYSLTTLPLSLHVHYTQKYYANMRMLLAGTICLPGAPFELLLRSGHAWVEILGMVRDSDCFSRDPACGSALFAECVSIVGGDQKCVRGSARGKEAKLNAI